MNTRPRTLHYVVITVATACAVAVSGCAKKEPAPAAPAAQTAPATAPKPATPATPVAPPAPAAPAPVAKPDPVQSMVSSAAKAAEATAAQVKETTAAVTQPATPTTAPAPSPTTPATPAALPTAAASLQNGAQMPGESTTAALAASATAIQKQAEELLTRYSGELTTLKSGALAVKSYVDQHPEVLPEAAKAKYQQFTTMLPQLESMVGTLKDYKSVDLTTLVPKLQGDFTKAKSLYSEVRSLLPANI